MSAVRRPHAGPSAAPGSPFGSHSLCLARVRVPPRKRSAKPSVDPGPPSQGPPPPQGASVCSFLCFRWSSSIHLPAHEGTFSQATEHLNEHNGPKAPVNDIQSLLILVCLPLETRAVGNCAFIHSLVHSLTGPSLLRQHPPGTRGCGYFHLRTSSTAELALCRDLKDGGRGLINQMTGERLPFSGTE